MIPSARRKAATVLLTLFAFGYAGAQQPKPLKLIVPFSPGGTADVLPRVLAEKIRSDYPAGVFIENRVGAGGNIGAEAAFRAEPDGSTLLASPPGPIAINQHLYKKLAFDPARWVPVTVLATVPNVLAVSTRMPVQNLAEFIAYAKANPGKVTYASQGNGSTSHLTAAMFMQLTGTEMTHVPYKGTAPALVDLVGGQIDAFFDNLSSSAPFHQSGKLRILAVADEQRSRALPQVPTFAESRLPAMNAVTFFSVVAPPGTPASAVAAAHRSLARALALPDVRARFAEQGAEPRGWSPEQTGRFIQAESDRWDKVIKSANVTLE
ncbi:tripartite tricarboxylate transporter substrate binding protein [uncultured Xylophilus sp.]|uniref:Bug family tripartite tricarboxylate transporter substrate binding protein n=1 Tax=uncultured Xylophilus sp. TaxID=296832 RepID=UPI0025F0A4E5|nr:tripartite tricarboxylate transporter substrate binding protein [uncultured Xylophilus sp.]